ncbi:hypothetical protein KTE28_06405 [Burkholderia multivorans]|nr:hypothetical protein [Burkholderia multivorans]
MDEALECDRPLCVKRGVVGCVVIVAVDEARIGQQARERDADRRLAAVDRAVQVDDGEGRRAGIEGLRGRWACIVPRRESYL